MARISGVDLPKNKRGSVALTYIYGIGRTTAEQILDKAGIEESVKVKDWSDDNIMIIAKMIQDEYKVEGELRSEIAYPSTYLGCALWVQYCTVVPCASLQYCTCMKIIQSVEITPLITRQREDPAAGRKVTAEKMEPRLLDG